MTRQLISFTADNLYAVLLRSPGPSSQARAVHIILSPAGFTVEYRLLCVAWWLN